MGLEGLVSKHRDTSMAPPGGLTAGSRKKGGAIRRLAWWWISFEAQPHRIEVVSRHGSFVP